MNAYLNQRQYPFTKEQAEACTVFVDDYTGAGYAQKSDTIDRIIDHVLTDYGIPLDSTYTGKAFAGMEDYLSQNGIEGKNILFIHTGGTPLFFDYLKEKKKG